MSVNLQYDAELCVGKHSLGSAVPDSPARSEGISESRGPEIMSWKSLRGQLVAGRTWLPDTVLA